VETIPTPSPTTPITTVPTTTVPTTTAPSRDSDDNAAESAGEEPERATAAPAELDLDRLAQQLYGRIRTRLRSELLIDRERSGLLADR
jgi:hypothetical protein